VRNREKLEMMKAVKKVSKYGRLVCHLLNSLVDKSLHFVGNGLCNNSPLAL